MADKNSIVTLNVGSQRVGLAKFGKAKGGGLVLTDYAFTELSGDPAADSARLPQVRIAVTELAGNLGVTNQEARYAISGHSVFTRFVKLPPLDAEKVDELVRFEAQQNVPFPIDEVAWDYHLLPADESGEAEAALVAIKSDSLDEINDTIEEGGLIAKSVDVAPMALYNAFRYNYPDAEGCALMIDVGARTTNLIYVEGDRVFTRSVQIGGAAASTAIASEFDMDFADAEERKRQDGFVSLGGNYADHEDPGIAAMSKVIRNTMTRLHGDIARTTSAYRQQGGGAPTIAYLCGGSASLPYLREFLAEKLGLEVEYFNALRNVGVGPRLDEETVGADAHTLGELVGLAVHEAGGAAIEIDLEPTAVESRRDIARRKPFLLTGAAALLAALLAGGLFYNRANAHVKGKLASLKAQTDELTSLDGKISDQIDKLEAAKAKAIPLATAVEGRTQLIDLCQHLNSLIKNDKVWVTQLEMLAGGVPLDDAKPLTNEEIEDDFPPDEDLRGGLAPDKNVISHIRIYGLYREDSALLYSGLQNQFTPDDPYFLIPEEESALNQAPFRVLQEIVSGEFAGRFRYTLELREPIFVHAAQ